MNCDGKIELVGSNSDEVTHLPCAVGESCLLVA